MKSRHIGVSIFAVLLQVKRELIPNSKNLRGGIFGGGLEF